MAEVTLRVVFRMRRRKDLALPTSDSNFIFFDEVVDVTFDNVPAERIEISKMPRSVVWQAEAKALTLLEEKYLMDEKIISWTTFHLETEQKLSEFSTKIDQRSR